MFVLNAIAGKELIGVYSVLAMCLKRIQYLFNFNILELLLQFKDRKVKLLTTKEKTKYKINDIINLCNIFIPIDKHRN